MWSPGDPHILGAYSYLAVGQYTAFNGIQGVRQGNLHFAGEQILSTSRATSKEPCAAASGARPKWAPELADGGHLQTL